MFAAITVVAATVATTVVAASRAADAQAGPQDVVRTFGYVSSVESQQWVVPPGVFSVTVEAHGASGAGDGTSSTGGGGAAVTASFPVFPGDVLEMTVGGRGGQTDVIPPTPGTPASCEIPGVGPGGNGFTIGGPGGQSTERECGGGGGGSTSVSLGGDLMVVAGGGGGGGGTGFLIVVPIVGGHGGAGYLEGAVPDAQGVIAAAPGASGHGIDGGSGGCGSCAPDGNGLDGHTHPHSAGAAGGGGGGGYSAGGGGGAGADTSGGGGGGGGNSFVDPDDATFVEAVALDDSIEGVDGQVIVSYSTPPGTDAVVIDDPGDGQLVNLPADVDEVWIDAVGAPGGGSVGRPAQGSGTAFCPESDPWYQANAGAPGAEVRGIVPVTPGAQLDVDLGGPGGWGAATNGVKGDVGTASDAGDGGSGGSDLICGVNGAGGGAGGGRAGVFETTTPLVVAGGGGGAAGAAFVLGSDGITYEVVLGGGGSAGGTSGAGPELTADDGETGPDTPGGEGEPGLGGGVPCDPATAGSSGSEDSAGGGGGGGGDGYEGGCGGGSGNGAGGGGGSGGSSYFASGGTLDIPPAQNGSGFGLVVVAWTRSHLELVSGNDQSESEQFEPLVVRVVDADDQPVVGAPVLFTMPTTGPTAVFSEAGEAFSVVVTSNAEGLASSPTPTACLPFQCPGGASGVGPFQATAELAFAEPVTFDLTVEPLTTTTTLHQSLHHSAEGKRVTFTATVESAGAPTGAVEFFDGTTSLGTEPLDFSTSQAVLTTSSLALGEHTITAVYSGDAQDEASTSPPLTHVVGRETATTLTGSATEVTVGAPVTFTATVQLTDFPDAVPDEVGAEVAPDGGTVTFVDGTTVLCADVPIDTTTGVATCTASFSTPGTRSVVAQFSGTPNDAQSDSAPFALQVDPTPTPPTPPTPPGPTPVPIVTEPTFTG
jgi:hypothetical protein